MDPLELARQFGLAHVLSDQAQVLRRDQALACGLSSAQISVAVRRGRWRRILPRVYLVGAGPLTAMQRVRAAWLWAGDDAAIAGCAAAWLHGVRSDPAQVIDVIVPRGRGMTPQPGIRVIRANVDPRDIVRRDGIRVTSAARTCLDLVRWTGHDVLEDALLRRRLTADKLPPSLARSRRRRGQVRARTVVAETVDSPWSKAERLAHATLRNAGIGGWVANRRAASVPESVHPDIAFEDVKLAVEIDGRRFHDRASDADAWERDHERELALVRAGWTVIRLTYRQLVEQPEKVVLAIREVLARLRSAARHR